MRIASAASLNRFVHTSQQAGRSVYENAAGPAIDYPEVVNEGGTVTFIDTYNDLPVMLIVPGEGVPLHNAGTITFVTTFTFPEGGEP